MRAPFAIPFAQPTLELRLSRRCIEFLPIFARGFARIYLFVVAMVEIRGWLYVGSLGIFDAELPVKNERELSDTESEVAFGVTDMYGLRSGA